MNKHLNATIIITFILAVLSVIVSANHNKNEKTKTKDVYSPAAVASTSDESAVEMRGLWVSYISLDMNGTDKSETSFRQKFGEIISTAKEYKCNTLFVHVRPFCDAFYKSDYFPSSHILWGTQGERASYDALEIMCEMSKKENLEIHAWINPFRVTTDKSKFDLSQNNPYISNTGIGIEYESGIYLNPANKTARKLIKDGILEIIENYDIDGIHLDDYFYPTDKEDFDIADYKAYLKGCKSETDAMPQNVWRQNNVNLLVCDIYRAVKEYDRNLLFGISPQGNIDNNYKIGADVKAWVENYGYVDYICPQLYYSLENPALKFEAGLDSWLNFKSHPSLKIYAGLAVYKAGTDADEGTWKTSECILAEELEIIRNSNLDGYILYDYEALTKETSNIEMKNFMDRI